MRVSAHWGGLEARLENAEQFKMKSYKCGGGEVDGSVRRELFLAGSGILCGALCCRAESSGL